MEQKFKEEFFMVGQVIGRKNFRFFAMVKCDEFSLVFNKEYIRESHEQVKKKQT